jgi:Peroxidase
MARSMGLLHLSLLLFSIFTITIADDNTLAYLLPPAGLDHDHYMKSCPDMEAIIQRKVKELLKNDYTYGAALIRLHFHDCAVRVCKYDDDISSIERIYALYCRLLAKFHEKGVAFVCGRVQFRQNILYICSLR